MMETRDDAAFAAEQALLGALLADRDAIADVVERITPDAFSTADHRAAYAAVADLWRHRIPPDVITLGNELAKSGATVDYARMCDWLLACPYGCHARYYADVVVEHARQRAIADAGAALVKHSLNGGSDPDEAFMALRTRLDRFGAIAHDGPISYDDSVYEWRLKLEAQWDGRLPRTETPTGFRQLDAVLSGGFRPGELIVVGARSGMGKSAFMLQLAHNAARYRRDCQALIFSAEMNRESLFVRGAAEISGLSYAVVKQQGLHQDFRERVLKATGVMEGMPVAIDDQSGVTTAQMQVRIERAQAHQPVSLVIFDYLEIAGDDVRGDSEERRVAEIARRCKHVARVCDVPFVLLSQLSREVERRAGSIPKLSDLRYSGAIEANADVVLLLYRPGYYMAQGAIPHDDQTADQANVIVAKQRNGPTPTLTMRFDAASMTFQEYEGAR